MPAPRPVLSPNAWPCTPCTVTGLACACSAGTGMGNVPDGLSSAWIARCACGVRPGWASRVCLSWATVTPVEESVGARISPTTNTDPACWRSCSGVPPRCFSACCSFDWSAYTTPSPGPLWTTRLLPRRLLLPRHGAVVVQRLQAVHILLAEGDGLHLVRLQQLAQVGGERGERQDRDQTGRQDAGEHRLAPAQGGGRGQAQARGAALRSRAVEPGLHRRERVVWVGRRRADIKRGADL